MLLSFEREPNYFAASNLCGEETSVIAETSAGEAIGIYACTQFSLYLNGEVRPAIYLHNLRVDRRWRHRISLLRGGFESIPKLIAGFGESAVCFTSVGSGNQTARRLLEAGVRGLPRYEWQGDLITFALPCASGGKGRSRVKLRRACDADIPALAAFHRQCAARWQFAPHLDESALRGGGGVRVEEFWLCEEEGAIRFCAALCDQSGCKQVVVRGYRQPLRGLRLLYNCWARLTGRVALPAIGERLSYLYMAFAAFDDDLLGRDRALALECIEALLVCARGQGAQTVVLGLSADHPLQELIARRLRSESYRTRIQTVVWQGQDALHISGSVQPEAALL
ncbi:hypothetical protein FACS189487_00470 [Campylobacterota bacterium]|nr:hypothetical protein FACS189487_00470 [Campylobacterota bacterium]